MTKDLIWHWKCGEHKNDDGNAKNHRNHNCSGKKFRNKFSTFDSDRHDDRLSDDSRRTEKKAAAHPPLPRGKDDEKKAKEQSGRTDSSGPQKTTHGRIRGHGSRIGSRKFTSTVRKCITEIKNWNTVKRKHNTTTKVGAEPRWRGR